MGRHRLLPTACQCFSRGVKLVTALLVLNPLKVGAERLPFRNYAVGDGLVHSRVTVVYQDRRGYLWFGTLEGLSRFDGYRFVNYGTADGLAYPSINTIREDSRGRLWVGTNGGGVARLLDDPEGILQQPGTAGASRTRFVSYKVGGSAASNRVNAILFDRTGTLWCATDHGFYRWTTPASVVSKFELVLPHRETANTMAGCVDARGHLWFAYFDGLLEIVEGRVTRHAPPRPYVPTDTLLHNIGGIIEDRYGRLLVAYSDGVYAFLRRTSRGDLGRWSQLSVKLSPSQRVFALEQDPTGPLWIGTNKGVIKFEEGRQRTYAAIEGLAMPYVLALRRDRDGNVWIGTAGGVSKLPGETIVSFTRSDGLPDQDVVLITEARDGRIYASTRLGGIVEMINGRTELIRGSNRPPFDSAQYLLAQDGREAWWIATTAGLFRFPGPRLQLRRGQNVRVTPEVSVLHGSEFPNDDGRVIFSVHRDAGGDLWAGVGDHVYRWTAEQKWQPVLHVESGASDLLRDRSGGLWFSSSKPEIGRWANGRSTVLEASAGLPEIQSRALFQDSRGWLWIGLRTKGVSVTKNPAAQMPTFINYSTRDGLASDAVWAISEDEGGRVYLGTGRGLDQLDPTTKRIRHLTTADGLAGDVINKLMRDRHGYIWVATTGGLSRVDPRALRSPSRPPSVYLTQVAVAGQELAIPTTGSRHLRPTVFQSWQNNLRIEYVGLDFRSERTLRYQYKLEGLDKEWSAAMDQRSLNYARLAPGSYQLLVRAVTEDGLFSNEPAAFNFRILAPIWQHWWFVALMTCAVTCTVLFVHHLRVRQLLAVEGIRRQIATDLHDDVGAGLSQIAILSEVAQRKDKQEAAPLLSESATLARALRESMGDIVWAVDPGRDRLSDLVQRMKQAAFNALQSNGLRVEFSAPGPTEQARIPLLPDRKRHLLLIFKEAVTNVARHAQASHVRASLTLNGHALQLTLEDDGRGFDPVSHNRGNSGQGLDSMRRRAAAINGRLLVDSAPGRGTRIQLDVPLR